VLAGLTGLNWDVIGERPGAEPPPEPPGQPYQMGIIEIFVAAMQLAPLDAKPCRALSEPEVRVQNHAIERIITAIK